MVGFTALLKRPGSARRLVLRTSAKVNLALDVLGRRSDGYHELSTVLQAVDLFDRLTVETAATITLETSDATLPTDDGNLVVRSARLWRDTAGIEAGARIVLDKRIPVAAGLGGGSSDAAATLWGLNRLWGLRWRRERLMALAVGIGMDVPFFLGPGRALGTGRGEVLKPVPTLGGYAMVLVNPGIQLSTQEVYGRVPEGWGAKPEGTKRMLGALRARDAAT